MCVCEYIVFCVMCMVYVLGFFVFGVFVVSLKFFDVFVLDTFMFLVIALCVNVVFNDVVVIGIVYDYILLSCLLECWNLFLYVFVSVVSGFMVCFMILVLLRVALSV